MNAIAPFSDRVLDWFQRHGRKDLPWQRDPTPYRVWVSEIMLQQTRVAAVIEYYQRFMAHFPNVQSLADAALDEVLHLWSGLGYYARARNMHRAAQLLCDSHGGVFPRDFSAIAALPGIGRSTAGAIMALSFGERHAILDGNVKRVLARHHEVNGWPGAPAVMRSLWQLAESLTPGERVAEYTQAMMDLGATVCTRGKPRCGVCPLARDCRARLAGRTAELPAPRPRRALPVRSARLLVLHDRQYVLLERRPPSGIWGGLWSLPECPPDADVEHWCAQRFGCRISGLRVGMPLRHTFTHFHFDMVPVYARSQSCDGALMEGGNHVWYNLARPDRIGLAAPIERLLHTLRNISEGVEE